MFARLEEFRFARWVKSLNRSTQILLSLTLVTALNYAAARHYERWDLTPDRHFSLSPETLAYLQQKVPRTPDTPLQIISILPAGNPDDTRVSDEQIKRLLDEYAEAGKKAGIPLEINPGNPNHQALNPLVESARFEDLQQEGVPAYTRILVLRGGRFHALNNADLYDTKTTADGKPTPTGFNGENAITSAILDVIQTAPDEIYFTTGHRELPVDGTDKLFGLSSFKEFLTARNFSLKDINLGGEEPIPATAKLVVIADASRNFTEPEIERLRQYLNQDDGRVLIFMDPGTNAGLEGLLHDWGLRSMDELVAEDAAHSTTNGGIILDPSDHPNPHALVRFSALSDHQIKLLFGPTRPVEVDGTTPDEQQQQVSPLLFSSKQSTLHKFTLEPAGLNVTATADSGGPVSVAALSEQHAAGTTDLPGGRLLVVGDAFVITNQYFNQVGNPDFILNCVNYLANRDNLLNIHPRLPVQSQLNISSAHYVGLTWRLGLLPAAVALVGLAVFWVRNRT